MLLCCVLLSAGAINRGLSVHDGVSIQICRRYWRREQGKKTTEKNRVGFSVSFFLGNRKTDFKKSVFGREKPRKTDRKNRLSFSVHISEPRMIPGTGTMYQVFIASGNSQQVPRSYCCTKRVAPLESSHGYHLPTRAASARAARGRCFDPKRAATANVGDRAKKGAIRLMRIIAFFFFDRD